MVSFHLLIFWVAFGNGLQFAMEHRHIGKDIGKTWYNISVNEPFFCHSNVVNWVFLFMIEEPTFKDMFNIELSKKTQDFMI